MEYKPEYLYGEIHIKTGKMDDTYWNGELLLSPSWNFGSDESLKYANWCTTDMAACDYDQDQLFVVFSKSEVCQMINALQWALTGCESHFDQDIWFYGDEAIPEKLYEEIAQEAGWHW